MPAVNEVAPPLAGCRTVAAGATLIAIIKHSAFLPTATILAHGNLAIRRRKADSPRVSSLGVGVRFVHGSPKR